MFEEMVKNCYWIEGIRRGGFTVSAGEVCLMEDGRLFAGAAWKISVFVTLHGGI